MRLGQPHLQRHHARLGPEAEDNEKRRREQNFRITDQPRPAGGEAEVVALRAQQEKAHQRHQRAERRVAEVLERRHAGLFRPVVQHQRHGREGHELKAHVEGHGVFRKGQGDQGGVGQQEEAEELSLVPLVLHVAEGVKLDKAPDEGHQRDEKQAQPVRAEAESQRVVQMQKRDFARKLPQHTEEGRADGEERRADHRRGGQAAQLFVVLHAEDDQRADDGRQE